MEEELVHKQHRLYQPHHTLYVSSYWYICVLILLHMDTYVPSYCYIQAASPASGTAP
jgi:hypothetical protein